MLSITEGDGQGWVRLLAMGGPRGLRTRANLLLSEAGSWALWWARSDSLCDQGSWGNPRLPFCWWVGLCTHTARCLACAKLFPPFQCEGYYFHLHMRYLSGLPRFSQEISGKESGPGSLNGGGKTSCDNGEKERDLAKQKWKKWRLILSLQARFLRVMWTKLGEPGDAFVRKNEVILFFNIIIL